MTLSFFIFAAFGIARRLPLRRAGLILLVALLISSATDGFAQTGTDDREPSTGHDGANVVASDRTIEVRSPARDEEITQRLQRILDATDRYPTIRVEVRDGVVFLNGTAGSDTDHDFAGQLARNTEDVVAVINNLEVVRESMWSLAPQRGN